MANRYLDEPTVRIESLRALVDKDGRNVSQIARDGDLAPSTLHSILDGHRNGTRPTLAAVAASLDVPLAAIADEPTSAEEAA